MSEFRTELRVCGSFSLLLQAPRPDVVLKFLEIDGKEWQQAITLPPKISDTEYDDLPEIENQLLELMYPVGNGYRLWLESPDGETVGGVPSDQPQFPQTRLTKVTHIEPDGREIIWPGDRSPFVHHIQLGWHDGMPAWLEVQANHWPATVFCVGNNQLTALPIQTLTEAFLKEFYARLKTCREEFAPFEGACWFIAPSEHPLQIPGIP